MQCLGLSKVRATLALFPGHDTSVRSWLLTPELVHCGMHVSMPRLGGHFIFQITLKRAPNFSLKLCHGHQKNPLHYVCANAMGFLNVARK